MFLNNTDKFDQHFLVDNNVINKFIEIASLNKEDVVVEIGPGKGQISSIIAKKVKKLICIELDTRLMPFLDELVKNNDNVEVIYANVLDVDIPKCDKIITSLPYSIVEPFINKVRYYDFKELIMITGKKFAKGVRDGELNKLSLFTNCYFHNEYIMDILPSSFKPEPRVVSSMIKLSLKDIKEITDFNLLMFRHMFYFSDKKIKNCIIESLIKILGITQRQSKEIVKNTLLPLELSEKTFEVCSNDDILVINDVLNNINEIKDSFLK